MISFFFRCNASVFNRKMSTLLWHEMKNLVSKSFNFAFYFPLYHQRRKSVQEKFKFLCRMSNSTEVFFHYIHSWKVLLSMTSYVGYDVSSNLKLFLWRQFELEPVMRYVIPVDQVNILCKEARAVTIEEVRTCVYTIEKWWDITFG